MYISWLLLLRKTLISWHNCELTGSFTNGSPYISNIFAISSAFIWKTSNLANPACYLKNCSIWELPEQELLWARTLIDLIWLTTLCKLAR